MPRKSEVLTAIGTLGCAMGIGFVMQSSDVAEQRYGSAHVLASAGVPTSVSVITTDMSSDLGNDSKLLDVQEITLTSAAFATDTLVDEAKIQATIIELGNSRSSMPQVSQTDPIRVDTAKETSCAVDAQAVPVAAAMVRLTVDAPCLPSEHVTIHHHGIMFSEVTSDKGQLSLTIPALAQDASFIVAFPLGEGTVAKTSVPEVSEYDRTVLQWKGDAGFQIHAREFGAAYGSTGHLWQETPGSLTKVEMGEGGFLTRHGNTSSAEPLMAEIYTFPRNIQNRTGDVLLTVEAEVTAENCGLEVEAQALELLPDGQIRSRNLILPVPSCDSVGSFLVLNNLLENLKVAAK